MNKLIVLILFISTLPAWGQSSSMRRCTLLPVTDSVGGAIGFKVFEEVEKTLKRSNWCTYVSNSSMMSVFAKYRDNLPQYLTTKDVLSTVADRLKVGSILRVTIVNEINGVEVHLNVHGENGEDLYFSEKSILKSDDIEVISETVGAWLDTYSKMIPYDAKVNGILGEQLTLDVGKGYPISEGQRFVIKRPVGKKKHPLLKKIVDWDTEVLAEGRVTSISDNQALGMVRVYNGDKKITQGDWVRLEERAINMLPEGKNDDFDDKAHETPGTLGVVSLAFIAAKSSMNAMTPSGKSRQNGALLAADFRAEGWITRNYIAGLEIIQFTGAVGSDEKKVSNSVYKFFGGYRYLPIGFFYGPQIDIYGGIVKHNFEIDYSADDGTGKNSISGLMLGTAVNVPISREFRFFTRAEFLPFPSFTDEDDLYQGEKSVSALELELGLKYQYSPRITVDGSFQTMHRKARFSGPYKEISYVDNFFKLGLSFNF